MKKYSTLAILFLFTIAAIGQTKTMGIGRLQVSLNSPIPLYSTFDNSMPFDTFIFGVVKSGDEKGKFTMNAKYLEKIKPLKLYKGDSEEEAMNNIGSGLTYFAPELSFRVLETRGDKFKVVINEESFETAIIKLDKQILYEKGAPYWIMNHNSGEKDSPWFLYETWEVYIKRLEDIRSEDSPIYDKPGGNIILKKCYDALLPQEVEAQWIKVSKRVGVNKVHVGWVRWTDGVKRLVYFIPEYYD